MKTLVHEHAGPDASPRRRSADGAQPEQRPDDDHLDDLHASAGNAAVAQLLATGDAGACACGGPPGGCACGGTGVQRAPDDASGETEFTLDVEGEGPGGEYSVYANNVTLHGQADADYGSTTFSAQNVAVRQGRDGTCTARGSMVSNFVVNVTVTLPPIPDGLNECQQRNAQRFIDNVLAPHEQAHVRAFETNYNGRVVTPFTVTACNADELHAAIEPLHAAIDTPRQAAANAASSALDPFRRTFDMDEGCETTTNAQGTNEEGGEIIQGVAGVEE